MNLFKKSPLDEYKIATFTEDKKLYSKYLKEIGISPINKKYDKEDILKFLGERYIITFNEIKKELSISYATEQIIDMRNKNVVFESKLYEKSDEELEKLYNLCIEQNIEIKYDQDKVKEAIFMIYPYTDCCIESKYTFNLDTIKILEGEENFTIKGFAKYEKSYELHVSEEDGYFKNETLEENTQEKSFTLPKIYKNGKNKELISILHKSDLTKNKFL